MVFDRNGINKESNDKKGLIALNNLTQHHDTNKAEGLTPSILPVDNPAIHNLELCISNRDTNTDTQKNQLLLDDISEQDVDTSMSTDPPRQTEPVIDNAAVSLLPSHYTMLHNYNILSQRHQPHDLTDRQRDEITQPSIRPLVDINAPYRPRHITYLHFLMRILMIITRSIRHFFHHVYQWIGSGSHFSNIYNRLEEQTWRLLPEVIQRTVLPEDRHRLFSLYIFLPFFLLTRWIYGHRLIHFFIPFMSSQQESASGEPAYLNHWSFPLGSLTRSSFIDMQEDGNHHQRSLFLILHLLASLATTFLPLFINCILHQSRSRR